MPDIFSGICIKCINSAAMGAYPKHVVAVNYHAVDFIVERIVAYVCGFSL